ncbi:peptidyl serine alpha-galactosyltransferase-like [Stylophora pistillata]|uniref:peptidyl serine alpha-galactosyltransferase-like n=1 Tax=Stylophora pistillata TaxID=50429 RepID=UPI000C04AE0A|nr:peptidyl serine alpha-galactosyltransferase-like [Stylophora pistillata]
MSKNCRKSCNRCQGGEETEGGGEQDCQDGNNSCKQWASAGYCRGKYANYMSKNCRKSCNRCQGEEENEHLRGGEFEDDEDKMNDIEEQDDNRDENKEDEEGKKPEEKAPEEDLETFFLEM